LTAIGAEHRDADMDRVRFVAALLAANEIINVAFGKKTSRHTESEVRSLR
jgi:hypothetical protein